MTDRDYLWCALNLVLDREEKLAQLCPDCRSRAEEKTCPVCGMPADSWGCSENFDLERFERMKEENVHEKLAGRGSETGEKRG